MSKSDEIKETEYVGDVLQINFMTSKFILEKWGLNR
jgi:hypothetical protein